ncbi:MAG TPA: hypothetical protein VI299_20950 [Polyangiales bacterium]
MRTLVLILMLSALGCGRVPKPLKPGEVDPWEGRGRECVRPFVARDSPYAEREEGDGDLALLASVPPEAARTMRAAGLSALVSRALGKRGGPLTLDKLALRQDLSLRLISLETQLSAVIFEAECTGELIESMQLELEDRADLHELRMAVASLVVGAAAATAAGTWDLIHGGSNGPAVLGLTGGVVGAGLGAAAFVKQTVRMRYAHDHNLLAPVEEGIDRAELYPRFVFRLLTTPGVDGRAPRDRLLTRWRELIEELPIEERGDAERMLYGAGGVYDLQRMSLRERMYDALESELNAQARDLELLDRFLVRALEG